jgi:choline kinase
VRAIVLCAGRGRRLGQAGPKALADVGGRTLLARLLDALAAQGVGDVVLVVGYEAGQVRAAVRGRDVRVVENPRWERGSVLSLWTAREHLDGRDDALVMDADVLFPREALRRLLASPHATALLLDRGVNPSGEEMLVLARGGRVLRLARAVDSTGADVVGEGVGFLKVGRADQAALRAALEGLVDAGEVDRDYEDAIDRFLGVARAGYEDVTDLPWTEVDFPEDLEAARADVLPAVERLDREVVA